jgi:hypothetical protein
MSTQGATARAPKVEFHPGNVAHVTRGPRRGVREWCPPLARRHPPYQPRPKRSFARDPHHIHQRTVLDCAPSTRTVRRGNRAEYRFGTPTNRPTPHQVLKRTRNTAIHSPASDEPEKNAPHNTRILLQQAIQDAPNGDAREREQDVFRATTCACRPARSCARCQHSAARERAPGTGDGDRSRGVDRDDQHCFAARCASRTRARRFFTPRAHSRESCAASRGLV